MIKKTSPVFSESKFFWTSSAVVLKVLSFLVLPLLLYIFVLTFPFSKDITARFHDANFALTLVLIGCFSILFTRKGLGWEIAILSLTLCMFSLPMVYNWQTGFYSSNIIGGILPFSDASAYIHEAQRLLMGERFTYFASRRPIFAGFVAVLLFVTEHNLQAILAIFVGLNALCVYLLAREVKNTHGAVASAFILVGAFIYFKRYAGILLSENIGLSLGAFALAVLWRGARLKKENLVLAGLFFLSVALNARAGTFFVLPAIILWGSIYFSKNNQRVSKSFFIKGSLLVALSFLLSYGLLKVNGEIGAANFSNYSYTFYGLVVGNKGWNQVKADYPGIRENEIWSVALLRLRENPGLFVQGVIGSYMDYFGFRSGAFSFTFFEKVTKEIASIAMWLLTGIGLIGLVFSRNKKRDSLLPFLFLGILLSVSLLPPIDSSSMRAYAASIPMSLLLVANGLVLPKYFLKADSQDESVDAGAQTRYNTSLIYAGSAFIILIVAAPVFLRLFSHAKSTYAPLECGANQEDIETRFYKGTYFIVVPDNAINESYLPYIRESEIKKYTQSSKRYPNLAEEIAGMKSGYALTNTINMADIHHYGNYNYNIFVATNAIPEERDTLKICASLTSNSWLKNYRFYYVNSETDVPLSINSPVNWSGILTRNVRRLTSLLIIGVLAIAFVLWFQEVVITRLRKSGKSHH